MANLVVKDGAAASKYLKASGAGDNGDPHIPEHLETNSAAIKAAVETIDNAIAGNEMQVDVVTSALPSGAATSANQSAANIVLSAIQTAVEALDNAVAGNELQVDVLTLPNVTIGSALPAGTNAIGKLAANSGVDIGDVDVTSIAAGDNNIGNVDIVTMPDSRESWRISTLSFTTTDDSDTTFTVPANTEYQILSVYVSLTTTSTAGNRQMAVQALDSSDNILIGARARVTQSASLTRVYNFAPGLPNDGGFYDTDYLAVSLPPIFLTAGQKLRVWDKAAIAAAADDMVVRVQIASRSIA